MIQENIDIIIIKYNLEKVTSRLRCSENPGARVQTASFIGQDLGVVKIAVVTFQLGVHQSAEVDRPEQVVCLVTMAAPVTVLCML